MAHLGSGALILALILAIYGIVATLFGARRRIPELLLSGYRATYAVAFLVAIALIALVVSFLRHDFRLAYVAGRSSRDMPLHYVIAAFYGGQEGSLLYWTLVASGLGALALYLHRRSDRALLPYMNATLLSVLTFLLLVLTVVSSPFRLLPVTPPDGAGLNPLLRDPGMMAHPPFLLSGYASFTVPFAFGMAALITGRLGSDWLRAIRRWTLLAWALLGLGLLIGAWWAYHVLGWGGYWGWDPVENLALLPWLTSTAFLHSVIVQERRGMLKVWNLALLLATFALCIFGTFIVRSGMLSSVHAFAVSAIGHWFLAFLALVLVVGIGLLIYRLPGLQSERQIESVSSREAGFLLNNLLLTAIAFAVFWGTTFPLFSELFWDTRITVGPPFYNRVIGPLLLVLFLLMAIGPLLAWRRTDVRLLLRNVGWPAAAGIIVGLVGLVLLSRPWAAIAYAVTVFAVGVTLQEFWRGTVARRRNARENVLVAAWELLRRNNRRYGGYLVHLAILLMAVGIIASNAFQLERQFVLRPGEQGTIGPYTVIYRGLEDRRTADAEIVAAQVDIYRGQRYAGTVESFRFFYRNYEDQPTARMGITLVGMDDVYVVLDRWEDDGTASLRVYVNPLVIWIWIGGVVFVLGTVTLFWPQPVPALARVPQSVAGATSEA
ncbi:cytochrome c biogenesis protein CcsA [Thermomicrobium sp. CFH 73360]|uniref:heme lyase CcmF/NrfE family subunit n=1 Tax=Thermomicrobium sp. CFH 73360 TaxID=2951987 RepID=UPI002076AE9E|nr:cytochrome c-type biogenesis CcmF C-terminal domain-containing protein [Thermomicrobium sp. CFH 73360]MCM8745098.1 cytochrome c biogenesis protein CcsA [Thermomicrobium sp. CFH 73360]